MNGLAKGGIITSLIGASISSIFGIILFAS
ncbi:hypothetical protein SLITO_v1c05520 [Spiroplasma litorale]|uniref:Uncharacterized protein n=1 Tax=Spiroplasma litorale TaxID=216942 RepID=A0A0K1W261_9MOLU|nr:hypothetical protein SLITO_v1c05520 [Spiroplasma litorale]